MDIRTETFDCSANKRMNKDKLATRLEEAAGVIKQVYRYVFHLITNVLWKIFLFNLIF